MSTIWYSFEWPFTFEGGEPTGDAASDDEHSLLQEVSLQFTDFLISLNVRDHLSVKDVCHHRILAKECDAIDPVADLSFRSVASSGHYQRHLTAVLNLDLP